MVIFVFPLFLLGTVTPSLVKYTVESLDDSGRTVGTLGAFNTVGSIIGTFLPTFVTIPAVGTSVTFLIFAGILLVLGLVYFLGKKTKKGFCTGAVLFFVFCSIFGHSGSFAFWEDNLLFEGESVYNYLQVKESEDSVILSTNVLFGVQSIMKKDGGATGMYYDYAMAAPLMTGKENPADCNTLILGMGTGTYANQCCRYYGNMAVEGVEIDEKITDLARAYFELPEDVKVTTYDGRAYLNAIDGKYDVIMVDAYQDITIPFQMSSVEFFELVREHLTQDGVMVVNMNMRGSGEDSINAYLADTISSVFGEVYTVDVKGSTNRELFASDNPQMIENLQKHKETVADESLLVMMETVSENLLPYEAGNRIMTDDKAPVELLGMRVIDELIRNEVAYYKTVYEEQGIQVVINAL